MGEVSLLFSDHDINAVIRSEEQLLAKEIESYGPDELLNTDPSDLADYFASKHYINVPQLGDEVTVESSETKIDV